MESFLCETQAGEGREVRRQSLDSESLKGRRISSSVEEARVYLRRKQRKLMEINKTVGR